MGNLNTGNLKLIMEQFSFIMGINMKDQFKIQRNKEKRASMHTMTAVYTLENLETM